MDWLSNRESMNPYVRIVSITSDGPPPPTDFDHDTVEVTDRSPSQVFSHWTDSTEWDSPEFRSGRCMATAFLRKFKPILNARRIKPNPLLTYKGLWKLARPSDPVPDENSDWPLTWTHAKVWLEKFRIPGLVIDIKGKVRCRYDPPRVNTHLNHARFDIILHNKHVWLVNKNVAEFGKRYSGKQPKPKLPRPRNSTEISDKWPRPDENQQKLYFVNSMDEILNIEIGGTTSCHCHGGRARRLHQRIGS